jgi:phosphate transport system substrate-binding protein
MKNLNLLSIIILMFMAIACGQPQKAGQIEGKISIDGSSTVYPLSEAVAEEYINENPRVKITVGESGTGGGFKKFSRGETDINDASRAIKQSEIDECAANNISFSELLVAYDGMAIVVHPNNTWARDITVEELKKIWEPAAQDVITNWNQIRSDWPDRPLHLYGAGTASGTFDYFTEAIMGETKSCRGDYTASEDDNVLVQGVAGDENALGFFGLAYFENNSDKIKLVPVDDLKPENGDGPVLPTLETVRDKSYSPLSRPLLIYVNNKAAERKEVQDFVTFYLENVSTLASEVGYIPLTDSELEAEKGKWTEFVQTHQPKETAGQTQE